MYKKSLLFERFFLLLQETLVSRMRKFLVYWGDFPWSWRHKQEKEDQGSDVESRQFESRRLQWTLQINLKTNKGMEVLGSCDSKSVRSLCMAIDCNSKSDQQWTVIQNIYKVQMQKESDKRNWERERERERERCRSDAPSLGPRIWSCSNFIRCPLPLPDLSSEIDTCDS